MHLRSATLWNPWPRKTAWAGLALPSRAPSSRYLSGSCSSGCSSAATHRNTPLPLAWSGESLPIALLLTALACLILGMEVPTTAAYVICVSVAGPALHELGLPPLMAHLFVFWYALLSTITPPVCGTVFIAAGMVDAPWLAVAGHSMSLGLSLYLLPLAFVANPALISPGDDPYRAALAFSTVAAGLWCMSAAVIMRRALWRRILFGVLALAFLFAPRIG